MDEQKQDTEEPLFVEEDTGSAPVVNINKNINKNKSKPRVINRRGRLKK
ncbi:hypothetical protein [Syntrophaceticus schinkii]|jgi:hypothetical protein|uniref:Uncharacterized protein n=1 Tax=Syntrophaceticus schinkii TaxID=499207 RepID=A0A0B7MHC7_9FIRM|nr:hypothetical protein [Syntrophaceticus schinkii]CEO90044.1 hypothetical protein SSCH_700031 [Syntrophaceticus schinkii]